MEIISDNKTSQKIMTRNVLVFLKKLLNSKIFYKLKLFCPYLQKLFNSERFYIISDKEFKRGHYFLCILSLKFKTLSEVMFEDLDSLFQEKYIPIYKLVIFQDLYFNILLYSYIFNILSYFRFMKNHELILHMYNYYRLMYVNRHLQNLDCINEEECNNATKLKGKNYETMYKKLDNKYLSLIKINI
ncbi:hypothetical protein TUBRATIS_28020 [Tubulinosema ratisbonensis]|uniref:Uncharacterized protein n=1 Tax=Tubulinosema ratisbonensis TaxID=291195 RepID=A0A437AI73_9MICR|nr:hypothetical protein TUBRATIS_28020 [Tubulinosema ratisbonensis]